MLEPAADAKGTPPWIVLLNGTSCSGKSTLARELVERAPAATIHLSLDHSHANLANRYATDRWPLYESLCLGLARSAAAWWQQGFHVVVDTLLRSPRLVRSTLALLPRERTFLVGVHAPLEVLLARAGARPQGDQRLVRRQFDQLQRLRGHDLDLASDREPPQALAERVLTLVGQPARRLPPAEALAGLRAIEAGDRETFRRAVQAAGCRSWFCYFPFLYAFARTVRRELRWEEHAGSVLVYHRIEDVHGPRLGLYLPPLPCTAAAIAHARERCRQFDPAKATRILWVEEPQLAALAGITARARVVDSEYVYDGASVAESCEEPAPGLAVRPYEAADRAACEALLEVWRRAGGAKRDNGGDYRLAWLCLAHFAEFDRELLRGEVVTQGGEVRAFTFGGPIGDGWGSLLVAIADPRSPELRRLQRCWFLRNHRDLARWTEGGDFDRPRIGAVRETIGSVTRRPAWRVVLRGG